MVTESVQEENILLFRSCILFPGDIEIMVKKTMQWIFRTKTGFKPSEAKQFMLYLTTKGELLVGFKKDKLTKPLIPLDDMIKAYKINKGLGII